MSWKATHCSRKEDIIERSGYWSGRKPVRVRLKVRVWARVRVGVGPRGQPLGFEAAVLLQY